MRRTAAFVLATLTIAVIAVGAAGAPSADAALIQVRTKYFGAVNVDPSTGAVRTDRVILSWFGVTNFAAAIGGHVVLLDAWVPRGEYTGYVPSSPEELAALRPEYIFVGHSHFDHLADAAAVMGMSSATKLVGTPEHCAQVRSQAGADVPCVDAVPAEAPPGTSADLAETLGWSNVRVRVLKHLHSAGREPDANDPHTPVAPPPDLGATIEHLPAPADTIHLLSHLGDGENGVLLFRFDVGPFSLAWHDSSGPLKQDAPELLEKIAAEMAPVDVELGAIMGFNQITNGLADPRTYTEALRPQVFVPTHHDNWAPPVSTKAANYRPYVEAELEKIPEEKRPRLLFIADPGDYVNPAALTFDVNEAAWGAPAVPEPVASPVVAPGRFERRPLPATGVSSLPWILGAITLIAAALTRHKTTSAGR